MRYTIIILAAALTATTSLAKAQVQYFGPFPPVPALMQSYCWASTYEEGVRTAMARQMWAAGAYEYMGALAYQHYELARTQAISNDVYEFQVRAAPFIAQRAKEAAARAARAEARGVENMLRYLEARSIVVEFEENDGHLTWPEAVCAKKFAADTSAVDECFDKWIAIGQPRNGPERLQLLDSVQRLKKRLPANGELDNLEVNRLLNKVKLLANAPKGVTQPDVWMMASKQTR